MRWKYIFFFFSSRRRHTRLQGDWSSDVCSSDLSGAAGMYAAIEAARAGSSVMLIDRSLIGRGGATVMAQMTVAVALGVQTPDHWTYHYRDTVAAGRGLCSGPLAQLLCEDAPACIEEMDRFGVGWARRDGRIAQATAPGHDRARCVYVDFLNT